MSSKTLKAELIYNGEPIVISISCSITGKYSFLNAKEYTTVSKPIFKMDEEVDIKVPGKNLFLISCPKDKSYRFCSSRDPENKLIELQEGTRHSLEIVVCCPYKEEYMDELKKKYDIEEKWFSLKETNLRKLITDMSMKRYTSQPEPPKYSEVVSVSKKKESCSSIEIKPKKKPVNSATEIEHRKKIVIRKQVDSSEEDPISLRIKPSPA